jgi:hypothetical protein
LLEKPTASANGLVRETNKLPLDSAARVVFNGGMTLGSSAPSPESATNSLQALDYALQAVLPT